MSPLAATVKLLLLRVIVAAALLPVPTPVLSEIWNLNSTEGDAPGAPAIREVGVVGESRGLIVDGLI